MLRPIQKQVKQILIKKIRSSIINWNYVVISLTIAIFIFSCFQLNITQDDAYISFRYAANYLRGDGLVYNHGERVEGYTNFLWVILLVLFKGVFGLNYLDVSRFIGVISGAAIFCLLYVLLKHNFGRMSLALLSSLAVMLLSNLSLPYWSISSLETSAFAFFVIASIVTEYRRPQLTPALLVIATLLRPEGVIVFVVVLINRFITARRLPWYYPFMYIIPLIPFAVFKLIYYGSLFPNPYYAKSGVGLEYIQSGLEYLWYFTRTIGVYGVIFFVPLLAIKRLWSKYSLLYLYVLLYIAYIVLIGGDVLKVYRFFVPVVAVLYFLFVISLAELISLTKFNSQRVYGIVFLCSVAFSFGSYLHSHKDIWMSREAEQRFIYNMNIASLSLKKYMGPDFSLAASTIGIVGYQLLGHRVIDMLGLTESHIARNPEKGEGMITAWKERRFNISYLLEQQPDFILFSTGYKPSAPAERSLMLHSEFRHGYSTVFFIHDKTYSVVWRRKRQLEMSRDIVNPDFNFVNKLIDGCDHLNRDILTMALTEFREARWRLGEDFPTLSFLTGECFLQMNMSDSALFYFQQALKLDSLCCEARLRLIKIANKNRDTAAIAKQVNSIKRLSPWIFDRGY